ncbi:MAG: hypothetical protein ACMUJM_18995 [bacterium]
MMIKALYIIRNELIRKIARVMILSFLVIASYHSSALGKVIEVDIDIRLESVDAPLNYSGRGILKVIVYGSDYFKIQDININTIEFGDPVSIKKAKPIYARKKDMDEDGAPDLVLFFHLPDLLRMEAITKDSIDLEVSGVTVNGDFFVGYDFLVDIVYPRYY